MNRPFNWLKVLLLLVITLPCKAQFAPQAGLPGSGAVHPDSSIIRKWIINYNCVIQIQRGWMSVADTALGYPTVGDSSVLVGPPGNGVLSLGDGGWVQINFLPLTVVFNEAGPDFVVFENGFHYAADSNFLELAHVEVTSDNVSWYRFPSQCLTDTSMQTGPFGSLDASKIHNLAGKYVAPYGVPFDLDDINIPGRDKLTMITGIRIIDVVGSMLPQFASRDSAGRMINDPWPTPYPSSGFDLDAIGYCYLGGIAGYNEFNPEQIFMYPNPVQSGNSVSVSFHGNVSDNINVLITDLKGQTISNFEFSGEHKLKIPSPDQQGIYLLTISTDQGIITRKFVVQ